MSNKNKKWLLSLLKVEQTLEGKNGMNFKKTKFRNVLFVIHALHGDTVFINRRLLPEF
jgi:hypothetical protein